MKNNKGITLIALVITIIVLLILAGVVIATLSGPNGLINKASQSKTETIKAQEIEKVNIALQDAYAQLLTEGTITAKYITDGNDVYVDNSLNITKKDNPETTSITIKSKVQKDGSKSDGESKDPLAQGTLNYANNKWTVTTAK